MAFLLLHNYTDFIQINIFILQKQQKIRLVNKKKIKK